MASWKVQVLSYTQNFMFMGYKFIKISDENFLKLISVVVHFNKMLPEDPRHFELDSLLSQLLDLDLSKDETNTSSSFSES